jgi:small subunit ribosomal protein S6
VADTVYECMFLLNANTFARNPAELSNAIAEIVKSIDGEMLVSRMWNEQKLAYPVQGHRKGVYWLAYFRAESTNMAKFNRACRLNDAILRHLAIKLEPRLVEPMIAVAKGEAPARVFTEVDVNVEDSEEAEVVSA